MKQTIAHIVLVVRDYDEAIESYTNKLCFTLVEDTYQPQQDRRWVIVSPPGNNTTTILLARASKPRWEALIGDQVGGRVLLSLATDGLKRDCRDMKRDDVHLIRESKEADHGTVVVFGDLYGNPWDLVQFQEGHPMCKRL